MNSNILSICWTVFGLGVCAVIISFISSCTDTVKNNDMLAAKQREACLEKGGSLLAGPNGTMQCLIINKN
jgi:hypothetical protein